MHSFRRRWFLFVGEEVPSSEEVYIPNPTLNSKVSLWHGDITRLEVDAIVCSTGGSLTGSLQSNTVFAAVHNVAGSVLMSECQLLRRCEYGNAKVAFGYNLPAKCEFGYVTVVGEKWLAIIQNHVYNLNAVIIFATGRGHYLDELEPEILLQCYQKCLQLVLTHGISSVVSCYLRTCTIVPHTIIVIDSS